MVCFPNLSITLPNLMTPHGSIEAVWARTHATYGAWTAQFTLCAYGGDLKPLLEQSIEMRDDAGNVCWCGYVDAAYRCCGDYMAWGWSSQTIINKLAISYTVGGEARRTDWGYDQASIARYGQREALLPLPVDTLWPTPELYRARILAEFSQPRPVLHDTYSCDCDNTTLHAAGAWRSLAWQRYEDPCGLFDAAPNATTPRAFGVGFTSDQIGFSSEGYMGTLESELNAFANGETIVISGSANDNDQVTDIIKHVGQVTSYTTTSLNLDPDDDVRDTHNGMNRFVTNQMLCLSAPVVLNAGCHFIKRVLSNGSRVEVHGGDIVAENLIGQSVTLSAGIGVQLDPGSMHEAPGATITILGYAQIVCQAICNTCANSSSINRVTLKLRKHGTPVDDVRVTLATSCTATGEQALIAASVVASAFDSFNVDFATGIQLTPGWEPSGFAYVRIERTGAPDTTNYYELATDSDNALTYAQISPDGIQWRSAGYAVAVSGVATLPVSQLLAKVVSSWVYAGIISQNANITFPVPTYRAGSHSLLYELEQLLALGDPEGKRLRMTLDCDGNITIDPEPEATTCIQIDCDGYPTETELCALNTGQWICPPVGINDVAAVYLQWFEIKVSSKTCRVRYVERDFTLNDLGYTLHWSGVA